MTTLSFSLDTLLWELTVEYYPRSASWGV